jgi:hypothetical protein
MSDPLPYPGLTQSIQLPRPILETFPRHVGSQPGHVRPNPIPHHLSPNRTYSVPRLSSREVDRICSAPDPNMSVSLTPQWLDSLGGLKGPSRLSNQVGHSF